MTNSKEPNRLIHEKSPYLLQHAYNPVNWFPWSCHAFAKAAQEDNMENIIIVTKPHCVTSYNEEFKRLLSSSTRVMLHHFV